MLKKTTFSIMRKLKKTLLSRKLSKSRVVIIKLCRSLAETLNEPLVLLGNGHVAVVEQ